jgi:hypothetical protein
LLSKHEALSLIFSTEKNFLLFIKNLSHHLIKIGSTDYLRVRGPGLHAMKEKGREEGRKEGKEGGGRKGRREEK